MAQLSDDCFAFGGDMLRVDEAMKLAAARLPAIGETESVALGEADNRILARDILAPLPLPPFTNSAVDGYAVRAADLAAGAPAILPIAGRYEAGSAAGALMLGHAARIFTGARLPDGADTVFMQEDVTLDAGGVHLPHGLKAGANVRPAGEDIHKGAIALRAGTRLAPAHIGLAAALGLTQIEVSRRLRVGVFSTGNELVSPGETPGAAQIFDANRFMLMALLRRLGCEARDLGILRDERAVLSQALTQAAGEHDLLLTSGGVSTGDADHVKGAVEDAGSLTFWRMAIKPGRPVAMGVVKGTPFIGLPGNPAAAFVTQAYVVRPAVMALMGALPQPLVALPVPAAFSYKKKSGRREFVRAFLRPDANGRIEAHKFPREGAGLLSSLSETDGLVELGEDVTSVEPGNLVGFLGYAALY